MKIKVVRKVGVSMLLFLLGASQQLNAQLKDSVSFGIESPTSISYSGLNIGLQLNGIYKNHSLGIGLKSAFKSTYFPHEASLGVVVDYKYFVLRSAHAKSYVSLNYSNLFYEVKTRNYTSTNAIHEYVISSGYLFQIYKGFWIGASIGIGGYTEIYYDPSEEDPTEDNKEHYTGYNINVKGGVSYEF